METLHDKNNLKFYILNDNLEVAELLYSVNYEEKTIKLNSTWVEEEYRNQNLASILTESLIDFAKLNNLKIIPVCSFGKAYFKRYKDKYKDLIFFK